MSTSRWGKIRPETMRMLLDLFCNGQDGRKSYVSWLCGLVRTGDNLAQREANDLRKWLIANGYPSADLGAYYTVQYTHDECAAAIGCDRHQARIYRHWLADKGVLINVHQGKKGYPAFFIVAPVLGSICDEIDPKNKGLIDDGFGVKPNQIRGGQNSLTCASSATSTVINSNPEKGNDKWKCSRCGSHDFELSPNGGLIICSSCCRAYSMPP